MSQSKTSQGSGAGKRNLPSWMGSRDNDAEKPEKKPNGASEAGNERNEGDKFKQGKGRGVVPSSNVRSSKRSGASSSGATDVSKLLEGVVFVLSGFVNPERSILRSQALEMGGEYQADWNSNCTLLICAFSNTPKFRQVKADCGTIVSKEWITECYSQKKLVDIESYLMHAGKPWRKNSVSQENMQDQSSSRPSKSKKKDGDSPSKPTASTTSEHVKASNLVEECFSPSQVKKWAVNDLQKTISWLESQDEKPDPDEIKQIAAEGILTCLQDAISSLEQKQDVRHITEQWNFIPRVVEELANLESKDSVLISKEDLCRQAIECKQIYELELHNMDDDTLRKKKLKTERQEKDKGRSEASSNSAAGYDSDETLEMTEEEIALAYNTIFSNTV